MNPEDVRAAAKKLRETARKATPGPWQCDGPYWWDSTDCTTVITTEPSRHPVTVMPRQDEATEQREENARWIALANPHLGEPLADLLDHIADEYDRDPCDDPTGVCNRCERQPAILLAELVANALLGRSA